jgi:hypothetical protein
MIKRAWLLLLWRARAAWHVPAIEPQALQRSSSVQPAAGQPAQR